MDADLIDLLTAWQGEGLDPARREQLLERLRRDEAFQQAFVDEVRMLGMLKVVQSTEPRWLRLQDALGWGPGEEAVEADLEGAVMRRIQGLSSPRGSGLRRWGALAAAVVVLAGGLATVSWPRGRREAAAPVGSTPPGERSPAGLALVVKLDAVRWEPGDGPHPAEGAVLAPGRFRVGSGRVTLSFFSGVTLTLEGPADVDLVAIDRVFCRRGRLRARVPEGAEGFVVASPGSAVVDLGTEFALNVEADGRSRVMVFEGKAEAALLDAGGSPKRTQLVEQTKAFELDPRTGRIAEAVASPEGFVPAPDLAVAALVLDPSYPAEVLASRPRGYWRFEAVSGGAVANEVAGGPPLRVIGPVEIAGGSRGNGCAVFTPGAPEQFLSTDDLWNLPREPGHAVEFWFLAETYSHASLVGFFPPLEMVPPEQTSRHVHTFFVELTALERQSLNKPASVRFLHRWPLDISVGNNIFSEHVYVPRRWHHVLAQKDGSRVDLYVDGVWDNSMPLDPDHPNLSCHLVVGRRTPDTLDPKDVRPFVGRLDELAIYDHPLSAVEVRHHFRRANPKVFPE
jgi:hypothetical protein